MSESVSECIGLCERETERENKRKTDTSGAAGLQQDNVTVNHQSSQK